ncbi:hypothetical protein, partial [Staphylococcus epidermidis]|uniref:hypothetical protein n=1 Tax=Staphylococcus epidermidis TaxID=1282 RepID=UPI0037D9A25A
MHLPSPLFHPPNHHHLSSTIHQPPIPRHRKTLLYHPPTPQPFHNPISLVIIYILKLPHIVDHKLHAPSTPPYSLLTQQPLPPKPQFPRQPFPHIHVSPLQPYR